MKPAATPPLAAPAGLDAARLLPPGTRLDEFEILRPLGVGGFGIVYLALDHSLLRQVALKEFMPRELAARGPAGIVTPRSDDCAEQFERALESFFNEARLLAPFNHPALVRVYRFWKANGTAYMAMQYCPGATLAQARRAMRAPPDEAWLRAFVEPILDALQRLHRAGVFHRDVSPDNILLLPNGRPILLDFGSARRLVTDGTKSLTAVLKPNFAPIEQYGHEAGMPQGPWTDLYALGSTVHFMLTGAAPTPAVIRVVNDLRTPLAAAGGSAYPDVGTTFLAAIDWAMAVAPNDRPQSVEALREALGDDAQRTPPQAGTPRPMGSRRGVLVACVLAGFGALCVAAWALVSTTAMWPARAPAPTSVPVATPRVAPAPAPMPIVAAPPSPMAAASPSPVALDATPVSAPVAPHVAQAILPAAKPDAAPSPEQRARPPKKPRATVKSARRAAPTSAAAEATGSPSPAEECAERNFISRAICVSRQCKAAGWQMHPECVDARRIEEKRQRWIDR